MPKSMRVREVAEKYDVSQHTILHLINTGQLIAVDVSRTQGGRPSWRITPEALEAFEQSRMPHPTPSQTKRRKRRDDHVIEFYT